MYKKIYKIKQIKKTIFILNLLGEYSFVSEPKWISSGAVKELWHVRHASKFCLFIHICDENRNISDPKEIVHGKKYIILYEDYYFDILNHLKIPFKKVKVKCQNHEFEKSGEIMIGDISFYGYSYELENYNNEELILTMKKINS